MKSGAIYGVIEQNEVLENFNFHVPSLIEQKFNMCGLPRACFSLVLFFGFTSVSYPYVQYEKCAISFNFEYKMACLLMDIYMYMLLNMCTYSIMTAAWASLFPCSLAVFSKLNMYACNVRCL